MLNRTVISGICHNTLTTILLISLEQEQRNNAKRILKNRDLFISIRCFILFAGNTNVPSYPIKLPWLKAIHTDIYPF